jgi:hypothetical protein
MFESFENWNILEYTNPVVFKEGDLGKIFQKKGLNDELVKDLFLFGNDENVEELKRKFKTTWTNVYSVPATNFSVFRGMSYSTKNRHFEFWNKLLGDKETTSSLPIFHVKDVIDYELYDYTSWSRDYFIAKGYAEERPGAIKVLLRAPINNFKVLAFLNEIGDESEEVVVYPIARTTVYYKAWRT